MENKMKTAVIGGVVGTAVITLMMIIADALGMPGIDYGKMLAQFTQTTPLVGWIMHFVMGVILAFVYVYYFRDEFQGPYPIRGLIYSIIPYVVTMIMLFPMAVMGTGQEINSPGVFIVATMVAYFAYGYVMGAITKPRTSPTATAKHPLTTA